MRFNVSKLVLKFIFQVNSFKLIWTHGLLVKWCFALLSSALLCSAPALFYSLRMNQIELLFLFITKCTFFWFYGSKCEVSVSPTMIHLTFSRNTRRKKNFFVFGEKSCLCGIHIACSTTLCRVHELCTVPKASKW